MLTIYREMIRAGLIPSTEMLSQVLGCLQLPKDVSLKKRLIETLGINAETSRSANLFPLIDGFAEYDPRAFSLFEVSSILVHSSISHSIFFVYCHAVFCSGVGDCALCSLCDRIFQHGLIFSKILNIFHLTC